jgi:UDP-2,4-diacetamido-2,4,6-trideoxy-beta-L-altropyranose hydrolase
VLDDVRDMASLMASMDLAVTGGGSTCWELAFLGLPAIVIELSDNQRLSARALAAAAAVENAGAVEAQDAAALAARIGALCLDAERRRGMSEAGRRLVDGKGGARVVGRLGLGLPPLTLRRATDADSRALWTLATEPSVRQQSFDPSPIAWETHAAWFERIFSSPAARMWVMAGEAGLAGQIRYEAGADGAEIGISVAPAFRGFGLAARLLASTWASACRELAAPRARGVVFSTNRSSAAAFREAGFVETGGLQTIRGHECHVFTKLLEP